MREGHTLLGREGHSEPVLCGGVVVEVPVHEPRIVYRSLPRSRQENGGEREVLRVVKLLVKDLCVCPRVQIQHICMSAE